MRVAHPVGHGATGDPGRAVVDQAGQGRGQQVDLDVLPGAGGVAVVQGGEDPDRGVVAGHHVEHRDPGPVGRAVGVTGQAHQAGHGLHHQVVAGHVTPGTGSETADGRVDHARIGGTDAVVAEPEPVHAAGPEVLDDDVGAAGQFAGGGHVVGLAQVERDRALAPVDAEEVGGLVVSHRRPPGAGVVTGPALDLDHVGAQVGQEHGGVGAGQDAGEVRDQEAGQRPGVPTHDASARWVEASAKSV